MHYRIYSEGNTMINISKFIAKSAGKFLTVTFIKQDGTQRVLNGRIGVTKHLKGGVSTVNTDKYLVLYDIAKQDYRCVNKDTVVKVVCEGVSVTNNALVEAV
jgi:hypothetical protein